MPYYFTIKQSPVYEQMTLEELLFGENPTVRVINPGLTNTRTYCVNSINPRLAASIDVGAMTARLAKFNRDYRELFEVDRQSLYRTFYIPKKSGGYRRIDAPNDTLMRALRELAKIFSDEFGALYHTSAYAYIPHRSTLDCMKRHQENESKWFFKADAKGFFNNTTELFVFNMFSMIFPFCEIIKTRDGKRELRRALSLGFLNGSLPQGTPLSPMITNIMMIPIDHKLANTLRDYNGQRFIYTRYADDIQISSRYTFSMRDIESLIRQVLALFNAPFTLNDDKTRYGSSSGHNFNLGLMLNKDNQLTIGYKRKREFRAALGSYIKDKKNGIEWELGDVMVLNGQRAYYLMVEKEPIQGMINAMNEKYNVNVERMIHDDLARTNARPNYNTFIPVDLVDDEKNDEIDAILSGKIPF